MAKTPKKRTRRDSPDAKSSPATTGNEPGDQEREEAAFLESLIATGQAAKPDADGRLPPGVTHELVEDQEGHVKAVRRRFSAY